MNNQNANIKTTDATDRPMRPIERAIKTSNSCVVDAEKIQDRLLAFLNRVDKIAVSTPIAGADDKGKLEEEVPELQQLQINIDRIQYQMEELGSIVTAIEGL